MNYHISQPGLIRLNEFLLNFTSTKEGKNFMHLKVKILTKFIILLPHPSI